MNLLVIGSKREASEIQNKFGKEHEYTFVEDASLALNYFEEQDVIFDFLIDEYPDNIDAYKEIEEMPVFLNIPKLTLAEIFYYHNDLQCKIFGFNGLPGFFENEKLEVSLLHEKDNVMLIKVLEDLKIKFHIVKDRVGMVTPRIICMIINEAFYTVQEGTATEKDIDLGMKLGTNYPYGPFEWLHRIGIDNVYELLEALYEDTKDQRYKIAPLLKRQYLMQSL